MKVDEVAKGLEAGHGRLPPEPAAGWTRALDLDAFETLEESGGAGVGAVYSRPEGQRIIVAISVGAFEYQAYVGMFADRGRVPHMFGVVHEIQGRNVLEYGAGDLGGDGHLVTILPDRSSSRLSPARWTSGLT